LQSKSNQTQEAEKRGTTMMKQDHPRQAADHAVRRRGRFIWPTTDIYLWTGHSGLPYSQWRSRQYSQGNPRGCFLS